MKRLPAVVAALVAGVMLFGLSGNAEACTVCYGDPTSPISRGAVAAASFMIVIVAGVLGSIAYYIVQFKRRADALDPERRRRHLQLVPPPAA